MGFRTLSVLRGDSKCISSAAESVVRISIRRYGAHVSLHYMFYSMSVCVITVRQSITQSQSPPPSKPSPEIVGDGQ